jgi:hypothetical protein
VLAAEGGGRDAPEFVVRACDAGSSTSTDTCADGLCRSRGSRRGIGVERWGRGVGD